MPLSYLPILDCSSNSSRFEFSAPSGDLLRSRLWIGATWPIAFVAIFFVCSSLFDRVKQRQTPNTFASPRRFWLPVKRRLRNETPLFLLLTFIVAPSVASIIFGTFLCHELEVEPGHVARYMHFDLTVDCDSAEYYSLYGEALVLIFVWPLGVPLLYMVLLWKNRAHFATINPPESISKLSFLTDDYRSQGYFWDVVDMNRKLVLTGWLLLIGDELALLRLVIAVLFSIAYLSLRLSIKPLRR